MELLRANIYEIKKSGSLKTLGGLLALFHVLQFLAWWNAGNLPLKFAAGEPICSSFFESCAFLHFLPLGLLRFFFYLYAVVAGLSATAFLLGGLVALGHYLLLIATGLGLLLYFQDLRLSSNEAYFIYLLSFAYLIVPSKHRLMRWLIVSFFVARGMSQASPDWLTGNWYLEHAHLHTKLAEWLAALSVLAQMIGGATLMLRDGRYFWTGWLSLFVFEFAHLYMGESLAASLAIGALLYVGFDEWELRKAEREYIYQSFIRPEPSLIWGGFLLAFFWAAQLAPLIHLPNGYGMPGWLDTWAIHPEAAHEECSQRSFAVYRGRTEEIEVPAQSVRQGAMACNVYMRFLDLKATCKQLKEADSDFLNLASSLEVRNYHDKSVHRAFETNNFCDADVTFKRLGEVQWNTGHDK